jgi:hypothetical protein
VLRNDVNARVRRDYGMDDAPVLPALDQVAGWSRADPDAVPTDASRALFGGWRIEEMSEEQRALARERRKSGKGGS